ncbi:beta-ketoacyl-ACP synthase 3 [Geopsychrobacter electrodiphilus]|uniref:beta-ketoacyl-ACP synthase 3 n=1 Tax=Geopsychrobacter electrodiphilus TaxID=225196 RepID=UPI0003708F41
MRYADITGWGKCTPPAILTNGDLSTFLETDDAWIVSRTGMKERRISHVPVSDLAHIACARALAAAGKTAAEVGLIIFGSCSFDQIVPNSASRVQQLLGADNAACMDLNTACTSGMYALSVATAMIRTGVVQSALVIGAEVTSSMMDWSNRDVAVLFGDGAAAFYLEGSEHKAGVVAESLGCFGKNRDILDVAGWGQKYANQGVILGETKWNFNGPEIFKRAVVGMSRACDNVLEKEGLAKEAIDLIVPHQANLRIIDALAKRMGASDEKVYINIQRYGNMSAATAPLALVEAIEEGRVAPGAKILMPAFGGGLTWSAHLLTWGSRTAPLGTSDIDLSPCDKTGLQLVLEIIAARQIKKG